MEKKEEKSEPEIKDHWVFFPQCEFCLEKIPRVMVHKNNGQPYPVGEVPVSRHSDGKITYICGVCHLHLTSGREYIKEMVKNKKELIAKNKKIKENMKKEINIRERDREDYVENMKTYLSDLDIKEERKKSILNFAEKLDPHNRRRDKMVKFLIKLDIDQDSKNDLICLALRLEPVEGEKEIKSFGGRIKGQFKATIGRAGSWSKGSIN